MRMTFRTGLAAMAVALTSTVFAADDRFSRVDANADGTIDKAEARDHQDLFNQFDSLDVNRNGRLSDPEFSVFEAETAAGSNPVPADGNAPHPRTPIP